MSDDANPILPELDALGADELRALVRAYHKTLQGIIAENNAFSKAQERGNAIWSRQVNERLAALSRSFRASTKLPINFQ